MCPLTKGSGVEPARRATDPLPVIPVDPICRRVYRKAPRGMPRPARATRVPHEPPGFTLLELLVVLALITLVAVLVLPRLGPPSPGTARRIRLTEDPREAPGARSQREAARLFAYGGVEGTPDVQGFAARGGVVDTASTWQVRQPWYSSSVGRWKRYRAHLGPLLAALGEPC